MNHLYIVVFILYILAMIALGWFVSRKQKTGDDFLLAGRNVPFILSLGTTVATMVGTGSSMGAVGFAYENGWAGALYGIGGSIGILLLAWIFAPVRRLQFTTMSEELAHYVDNNKYVKNTIAFIIYAASIGWLGAHIIGGSLYLSWLTGIDVSSTKLIIALSFAVYVVIGGYTAVVWTDSIQALILFTGFILMAYFSLDYVGGWDSMLAAQPSQNISLFAVEAIGIMPAISLALAILVGVLATPSFRQRIYSGKNVTSIRKSFIYSGVLYLGFSLIPAIIGMSAYAITNELDNAAFAFPHIALNVMPLALGVLIIIAGISATLSSASSDAIAGVSVLLTDIYQIIFKKSPSANNVLTFSRIGLILTIGIALLLALMSNNIISYITQMIAVLMSGLCVCGLLGRLWPAYNWQGAMASLLVGMLTAIGVSAYPPWNDFLGNSILPAIINSALAGYIVTLISQKSKSLARSCESNS
ncbi:sodium:solute symporter family protein [Paraglaciecola arctica]|uniref:Solute:Na+ symporter, SSS family n=1 Tax=Paraglaciecola arctica BSs20135 TaxID=493475 RepID=K6YJ95_9ALTE|nr:sodium:solute symporter family protein [Paraglaciecola arctica]GAC18247.1 solute:Na+ symporter, SSS family [Paraglaciecola arctica BSs20135]